MDTPYEKLDEGTRQEWREHPTTLAFLATIGDLRDQLAKGICLTVMGGGFGEKGGAFEGGQLQAYDFVIHLAARKGRTSDE